MSTNLTLSPTETQPLPLGSERSMSAPKVKEILSEGIILKVNEVYN